MLFPTTGKLKVGNNKNLLPLNIKNIIPDRFMPIPMLTRASVDLVTHKTNFSTIGTDVPILPNELGGSKTFSNANSRWGSIDKSANDGKLKIKNRKGGYRFSSINTERMDDLKGLMTNSIQSRPLKPMRPENDLNLNHLPNITESSRGIENNYGSLP